MPRGPALPHRAHADQSDHQTSPPWQLWRIPEQHLPRLKHCQTQIPSLRFIVRIGRERRPHDRILAEGARVDMNARPGDIFQRQFAPDLDNVSPGLRPSQCQAAGRNAQTGRAPELLRLYRRAKLWENWPLWNRNRRRPRSRIDLSSANVRFDWRWNTATIIGAKLRR